MRILVDIVHPADVLFFRHPLAQLLAQGAEVRVASREKDVACALLDEFGLPHAVASKAGMGTFGLARELVVRDAAILRMARGPGMPRFTWCNCASKMNSFLGHNS